MLASCLSVKKELALLLAVGVMLWVGAQQMDYHVSPWLDTIVLQGEVEGAEWVKQNSGESTLLIAGIFGGEIVMGVASKPSLVGGDWAANPGAVEQMDDTQEFYATPSPEKAAEIMKKYGVTYAWFPSRKVFAGYGWLTANEDKMLDTRFELAYKNNEVRLYALRQSM